MPYRQRKLVVLVAAALCAHAGPTAQTIGLPITFERNDGQFPADVMFASRGVWGTLSLRAGEIAITPRIEPGAGSQPVRLRMLGANPAPEVHPANALVTRSHYYVGGEPRENIPHFGALRMKDVYPGIDVELHGRNGVLEYDFVVAPGADPRDIRIDLRGLDRAALDVRGNLRFEQAGQVLTQHAPVSYQGDAAQRQPVDSHFEMVEGPEGPEARIALGPYDARVALTVDPVISYSTYVGGSGTNGMAVQVDPAGHVYYAYRERGNFGSNNQVLNRLDPATNTIIYQTNFGGPGTTNMQAIALGGSGGNMAYIAGDTTSTNFPVAGAPASQDGFVAAFSPAGTLVGGTRIGGAGSSGDTVRALALDNAGNIYVGGRTASAGFIVTGGQSRNGTGSGSASDGFAAKYTNAFARVYQRLLGGSGDDEITGVAVDPAGQLIVVGTTSSANFPVANVAPPVSPAPAGGLPRAFAAKLAADGMSAIYSQFVGGQSLTGNAVALDPSTGDALVVGYTDNPNFIPASAGPYGGTYDGWIVRLGASGTPTWGTLLGGSQFDSISDVAVSAVGDIYVTGMTNSTNFPVVDPLAGHAVPHNIAAGFITRFRGGVPDFSTYLSGNSNDVPLSIVARPDNSLYVGGITGSSTFPVVTPYRGYSGGSDGFVTRVSGLTPPAGPPRLGNISTRMQVLTGNDVMIGGFVIGGSANKTVVVRARGPSLVPFGIANALANPQLQLVRSSDQATIAINDDWQSTGNLAELNASGFAPSHPLEAAILVNLPPGAYTAIVSGVGGGTGVGIVEVFEVDTLDVPLANISTRGQVLGGDDVMIGGFVIQGSGPQTVVIRARGPSLVPFGITNALANPTMRLVRSSDQATIESNDDWQSNANAAAINASGFAPSDPLESALLVTLPPGAYTVIVSGVGGGTGVGIVEVFAQ